MGPKISHLTSVHQAFDTRIFRKECRSLADVGYEVVLIAPHDRDETVDGVRIRCVPRPRDRRERMTRTIWQVLGAALAENAALYHFHDPELIPVGMILRARGKRVFYDAHENVPGAILTKRYLPAAAKPWIAAGAGLVEGLGTSMFDGVIAATPAIARRFPRHPTIVVQNFPIPAELALAQPGPYAERERLVAYVGDMTEIRGIREMVQAMARLPSSTEATLALAGNFAPGLETDLRRQPGWGRVQALGWQSREAVWALLGRARAGLVVFLPGPNHVESQPNKLFEYMAAGLPVVASDFPLWRRIVEDVGCGLLVNPADPRAIAQALGWLLEHPTEAADMGQRGVRAVAQRFNWGGESSRLVDFYQATLTKVS